MALFERWKVEWIGACVHACMTAEWTDGINGTAFFYSVDNAKPLRTKPRIGAFIPSLRFTFRFFPLPLKPE